MREMRYPGMVAARRSLLLSLQGGGAKGAG